MDLMDDVYHDLKDSGVTRKEIHDVINAYNKYLMEETADGATVVIRGVGRFEAKMSKPKRNLNLQTREVEVVRPIRRPKFHPGKVFRELTESR